MFVLGEGDCTPNKSRTRDKGSVVGGSTVQKAAECVSAKRRELQRRGGDGPRPTGQLEVRLRSEWERDEGML